MKKFFAPTDSAFSRAALTLCVIALLTSVASSAFGQSSPSEEPAPDAGSEVAVPKSVPEADGVAEADSKTLPEVDELVEAPEDEPAAVEAHAGEDVEPAEVDPEDDTSWRIKPSGQPPIQVRRAVEQVTGSATRVAAAISGDGAAAKTPEEQSVERRVIERGGKLDEFKTKINFTQLKRIAGQMLTAGGGDQLVLTPYVSDPRWVEAMQLLKDDDCEDAHTLATEIVGEPEMHKEGEPAIRYALARIQMCTKEHEAAGKKTLKELAKAKDSVVAELARRRLGLPAGKDSSEKDEGLYLRDRINQAKRLARKGKVDEALQDLDTLDEEQTRWWHKYQVRSAQVEILERAGRLKDAARKMLGIYRVARDWNIGDAIEDRLERIQKRAGVEVLTFGERVDRMRDLIARGRYRKAREVSIENAKLRGVSGNEIKGWSFYRRALQEERQRDREKAAEMFEQAEKLVKDDAIRPRLYFGWARALRRLDRDTEAIKLYRRLCDEYPRHHLCDDAYFEAGRLSQYLGKHDDARDNFALVVGLFPFSEHVPQALWRGAFSAYLMEDYEAMQSPLEQIVAFYGDEQDASELTIGLKAQYWLGVAKLKAGDKEGARVALQKAIDKGPLTWYGRLAVARMEKAGFEARVSIPHSTLAATELKDLSTLRVPRDERLEVAAAYSRLGLYDDAISELREQVSIYPVPEHAHEFMAAVYLADDQPNYAHWIMKKHIDETGPGYHNLREWGVAFPTDFMELAHKYGAKYGVSPFLVQAIIRQESGFRPGVSSYAGAMGLMQLMPGTARYTQRQFLQQGGHLSRSEIVRPETNVKLGTMYIRIHTAFAADQIPLALAGYNAGPAPLESWFERYGERELDAWVESITYREARGYVRKVFTSYVTYAGLYGSGELPKISLEMPEKLREWGDVPEVDRVEEGEPVSWVLD
ncbi:tetratricopeptide repeat protein [Persicimonas caeni]|uniref:Tetratricopeptide repeat protein n=1 Tax=Persicimonas caeni TaxID=2292766 RepID=A0A4Y6PRB6_PERCE|nr:transglycosylase SLT domain-containing protein [Persicimonas caeni]QDG50882.1 tetratricopeptide repeat protein [Persicimonas caeni]QED32103.1 tetratricopeptide repeat protein [Persicimonas caeni]